MPLFVPNARLALYLSFFGLAVSFTSTQFVVDKSFEYNVARSDALAVFFLQQTACFFTAFVLAGFVPSAGHKRILLFSLALLLIAGGLMPIKLELLNQHELNFLIPEVFYFITGIGFGLIKTIVYSYSRQLATNQNEHASLLNRLEAWYSLGALASLAIFGGLSLNPAINLEINYIFVIVVLITLAIAYFVYKTPLADVAQSDDLRARYGRAYPLAGTWELAKLLPYTLVAMFVISLTLFTLTESHFANWLPLYLKNTAQLSEQMQVQFLLIMLAITALGKLISSYALLVIQPYYMLVALILGSLGLTVFFTLLENNAPAAIHVENWTNLPQNLLLLLFVIGFTAPVGPTLCSTALWHTPANKQSVMVGLIILINTLGWVGGGAATTYLSQQFSPIISLAVAVVPLTLLLTITILFITDLRRGGAASAS